MSNKIKTLEEMERLVLGRPKQTLALVAANSEESLENRRVLVRITGFAGEEALTGEVLK